MTIPEPKLKDIATLEAKRWKWNQRAERICKPLWDDIYAKVVAAGTFGGFHKFAENGQGLLEFDVYKWLCSTLEVCNLTVIKSAPKKVGITMVVQHPRSLQLGEYHGDSR